MARDARITISNDGQPYVVVLRECTREDRRTLVTTWGAALERGPSSWLDREWMWGDLTAPSELAFAIDPEWVVVADEVEPVAQRDLIGVLVTTGPVPPARTGIDPAVAGDQSVVWVEYIAIAPGLLPGCPAPDRRRVGLKGIGPQLMRRAIERSVALGCEGRIGLHAEGAVAVDTYRDRWNMRLCPDAPHPAGGSFPVFFGGAQWATAFLSR